MAKITYASLKLKTKDEVKILQISDKEIEIKQYLSIADKDDLINSVLQKSINRGVYDPLSVEKFFHLNIIYLYTNISFTESQKSDENKIYDAFESNGLINLIIENIPDDEYDHLLKLLNDTMTQYFKYNLSAAGIFKDFVELLPTNAQKAADIINGINSTDMSNVINFAKAINNGN